MIVPPILRWPAGSGAVPGLPGTGESGLHPEAEPGWLGSALVG